MTCNKTDGTLPCSKTRSSRGEPPCGHARHSPLFPPIIFLPVSFLIRASKSCRPRKKENLKPFVKYFHELVRTFYSSEIKVNRSFRFYFYGNDILISISVYLFDIINTVEEIERNARNAEFDESKFQEWNLTVTYLISLSLSLLESVIRVSMIQFSESCVALRRGWKKPSAISSPDEKRGEGERESERGKEGARGIAVNLCVCDHRVLRGTAFFFERNIVPSLTNVSSKHPSRDFQDVSPPPPHPPLCFFNIVITDFDFLNFSNLLKNCIIRIIRGKVSPRESFEERKVGSFPVVVTPSDRLFNISGRNQPYRSVALAG